jgi:hypothetical protein
MEKVSNGGRIVAVVVLMQFAAVLFRDGAATFPIGNGLKPTEEISFS